MRDDCMDAESRVKQDVRTERVGVRGE